MESQPHQQQSKHDRSRTRWTAALDKLFVDLVLEQVLQGNRANNVFSKMAWKHIRDEFNKQTGLEFDRKQLKKHLDVLRNRYNNVKSHFVHSSFGGDDSRHTMMTGSELWDDYIEEYPLGETSKIKDCPIYDQLCKIFTESSGIGRYAQSSHYVELDKGTAGAETPRFLAGHKATSMAVDPQTPTLVQDDSSSRSGVDVNLDVQNKCKPITPSSSQIRKRNHDDFGDAMAEAMLEMAMASRLRANAMIQRSDQFSITKCVEVLDKMRDVDENLYFAALNLFDNPNRREIFISLRSDKRLTWLQGKCCSNNNYVSREKCKKCGQPKEVAAMQAIAMPGPLPTYAHYFSRAQGAPGLKINAGIMGNSAFQQSLPLNSNWSLGGADKFGNQSVSSWPLGGSSSAGFLMQIMQIRVKNAMLLYHQPMELNDEFLNEWDNKGLNAGNINNHFLTNSQQQAYHSFDQTGGSNNAQTSGMDPYPSGSSGLALNSQVHLPLPQLATVPTFLGKGRKQWRNGDWMCTNCNNHNCASRPQCNRCNTERKARSQSVGVE